MARDTLSAWLDRLERRAPEWRVHLGLERVREVYLRMDAAPAGRTVITVAGTNGKGSVIAFLEAIHAAAGISCFAYTSPHILRFNERMRFNGHEAGDGRIAEALEAVEAARRDVALTWFEHVTLAGLWLAARAEVEVLLLETGLGGRLDAVNVVDSDVAVITSIGLDHRDWLGPTRAAIAREKAGIARPGRPALVGERRPPEALDAALEAIGARIYLAGRDFSLRVTGGRMRLRAEKPGWSLDLPVPPLPGRHQLGNAALAVMAAKLSGGSRVTDQACTLGIETVHLPGRFERVSKRPEIRLDVAHNPAAARALAGVLATVPARTLAVIAVLADKDARGMARVLDRHIAHWFAAGLQGPRGRDAKALAAELKKLPVTGQVDALESVPKALDAALAAAGPDDRVVVFGSFQTVAAARRCFAD